MCDRPLPVLTGVLAVLLAGCTGATAGSPTVESTPTISGTSQAAEPDRHGAPRVANPLNVTKFISDPCAAIPPALRPGLGLPGPGEPDTTGALGSRAPACAWVKGGQGGNVAFLKANQNGLADLYRGNAASPEAYWQETTVEGYPAVFHGTPDLRSRGNCVIAVGLSDTLAMSVIADDQPGASVCERAKQIAAAAVKTIREAR